MLGHTLGAAGAVEAVVSTLAIDRGTLPPTINTRGVASPFGLDVIPDDGREAQPEVVVSNSFAFGGNNASVVINRPGLTGSRPPRREAVQEVVVTGVAGLAGSAGDTEAIAAAFAEGRPCFASYEEVAGIGKVPVGRADIKAAARGTNPSRARRMDPLSLLAASVVNDLYARHGKPSRAVAESTGIVFATGYGPVTSVLQFHEGVVRSGIAGANPSLFANTVVNAAAGHVAMLHRFRGYTATIANGGTSSVLALQLAARVVARGVADRIMVVVADEFPGQALATQAALPGYARSAHIVPGGRTGTVLSEGAAAILLESREAAEARGAGVLARVRGFGAGGEAAGIGRIARDGEAWGRALRTALADADLDPAQTGTVVSAASGHPLVDLAQRAALRLAGLADRPVLAPKALLGESYGSAGALGLVAALTTGNTPGPLVLSSFAYGGSYAAAVLDPET
jgi:3-oxoacyl-[acyl-carrier-protein] synthase II